MNKNKINKLILLTGGIAIGLSLYSSVLAFFLFGVKLLTIYFFILLNVFNIVAFNVLEKNVNKI